MTAVQEKRFSYTAVWLFPQSEKSDRNVKKKRQGRQDMCRRKYWKDRIPVLVINGVGMVLLSVFLLLVGNSPDSVALILLVWILSLFVYLSVLCWRRKRKLDRLLELAKNLNGICWRRCFPGRQARRRKSISGFLKWRPNRCWNRSET